MREKEGFLNQPHEGSNFNLYRLNLFINHMYLKNYARDWDDFFNRAYPRIQKTLQKGPEKIEIYLPSDVKDATEEREFKQRVEKNSKEIIEKLSNMGRLRSYWESIKEKRGEIRLFHFITLI